MARFSALAMMAMTLSGCVAASADERDLDRESPQNPAVVKPGQVAVRGSALDYGSVHALLGKLDGVEVCVETGGIQCATTSRGRYELPGLTPSSAVAVSFMKDGYVPSVTDSVVGPSGRYVDGAMLSISQVIAISEVAGVDIPGETGGVVVTAYLAGYADAMLYSGVRFSIVEPTPAKSVYVDDHGAPSSEQSQTGRLGWGAALGLKPGRIVATVSHDRDEVTCGIASTTGTLAAKDVIEIEVRAGMLTHVVALCIPNVWLIP